MISDVTACVQQRLYLNWPVYFEGDPDLDWQSPGGSGWRAWPCSVRSSSWQPRIGPGRCQTASTVSGALSSILPTPCVGRIEDRAPGTVDARSEEHTSELQS